MVVRLNGLPQFVLQSTHLNGPRNKTGEMMGMFDENIMKHEDLLIIRNWTSFGLGSFGLGIVWNNYISSNSDDLMGYSGDTMRDTGNNGSIYQHHMIFACVREWGIST